MVSSSLADVVIPALLVVAWLLISPLPLQVLSWLRPNFTKNREHSASISEDDSPASGYILPVLIHHARMLPKESQHSFRYPSLFLALKLDDLEKGNIQLNRVFSYTPVNNQWCLSKLDPDGFGRRSFPGIDSDSKMHQNVSRSILLKLMYELRARNYLSVGPQNVDAIKKEEENAWDKEVGHVWAIAMPTLLGLGGFNPLTVYYVYRPSGDDGRGKLWLVVLEVHNTFNERHVYICQVGVDEDQEQRKGYQHSWTFAREFHVSPFNDRLGYYQLLMNDLWNEHEDNIDAVPTLDVRLLLLSPAGEEADDEEEEFQREIKHNGTTKTKKLNKKLLATLMSSKAKSNSLKPSKKGRRMTRRNMLSALALQPFDLILPVGRIMFEAAKLHWRKGLPVFIRPEQRGEGLSDEQNNSNEKVSSSYDGLDWPVDLNPTQNNSKKGVSSFSSSGSIYWNQDTFLEKACQSQFEKYIHQQTMQHKDICMVINNRNAEVSSCCFYRGVKYASPSRAGIGNDTKQLSLYTLSSSFYLDFALYTPSQARLFGSLMDRNWGVSSVEDYQNFFFLKKDVVKDGKGWKIAVAAWARRRHMQWAVRQSPSYAQDKNGIARQLIDNVASNHPYNSMNTPLSFLLALLIHILIIRLTAAVSALLHINYVRPPWAQVAEGYQRLLNEAH